MIRERSRTWASRISKAIESSRLNGRKSSRERRGVRSASTSRMKGGTSGRLRWKGRRQTRNHDKAEGQKVKLLRSIVRRLLRNRNIVHVTLADAGRRDSDQLGLALQRRDVGASTVAHPRA